MTSAIEDYGEDYAMSTRILIADDDATIRLLLRRLLEKHPSWQVCGDASNGAEAIQKIVPSWPGCRGHGFKYADHDWAAGSQ